MSRRPRRAVPVPSDNWAAYMHHQLAADRQGHAEAEPVEGPRQEVIRICLKCRARFRPAALERTCATCAVGGRQPGDAATMGGQDASPAERN